MWVAFTFVVTSLAHVIPVSKRDVTPNARIDRRASVHDRPGHPGSDRCDIFSVEERVEGRSCGLGGGETVCERGSIGLMGSQYLLDHFYPPFGFFSVFSLIRILMARVCVCEIRTIYVYM